MTYLSDLLDYTKYQSTYKPTHSNLGESCNGPECAD